MRSLILSTAAIMLSAGVAVAQDNSDSSMSSDSGGSMNSNGSGSMSSDSSGSMNSDSGSSMSSDSGSSMSSDSGSSMSSDSSGSMNSGSDSSNNQPSIQASDQSVGNGVVSASSITANQNGWMVVHRTEDGSSPGPVVGHAPLRSGSNQDVAALLTEEVSSGDMLMLMVHSEEGGNEMGVFEYTLGASEDGPIRMNDELVTSVITVQ